MRGRYKPIQSEVLDVEIPMIVFPLELFQTAKFH
jgi:hypothetical protein